MAEPAGDRQMALLYALLDIHRGKEDFLKAIANDMNHRLNTSRFNKRSVEVWLRIRLIHKGYGKLRGLKDRGTNWLQPGSFSKGLFDATNTYRQEFGLDHLPQYLVHQSPLTPNTLHTALPLSNPSNVRHTQSAFAPCSPEFGTNGVSQHYDFSQRLQISYLNHEMMAGNRPQNIQYGTTSQTDGNGYTVSIASGTRREPVCDKTPGRIVQDLEDDAPLVQCNSRFPTLEHRPALDSDGSIRSVCFNSYPSKYSGDEINRLRFEADVLKEENSNLREEKQGLYDHIASLKGVIKETSKGVETERQRVRPFERKMESKNFGKDFGMLLKDMYNRDIEREYMRTTFKVIFGNSTNRDFPLIPLIDESRARWEDLYKKLVCAFEVEAELPNQLSLHRVGGDFGAYMKAMLGYHAVENPIANEPRASISPLHMMETLAGVFLCLKVFDSWYPNFARGLSRQLEKVYTLLAVKDSPSQIEALHVAVIAQLANDESFQQDDLPEKAKQWVGEFRQLSQRLLPDAPESAHTWSPESREQRFTMLEGCLIDAVQLKVSRLTSPLKLRSRIQWVSAHAKFEESWMTSVNDEDFQGHDKDCLNIRLCLFPALLQGIQDDPPDGLGPAGLASAAVHDQRFSVGSTTDSLEVPDSAMNWRNAVVVAKAVVLVERTEGSQRG